MHTVLVNGLVKVDQEKSVVRWTDMTIAVDWDVKHQTKQTHFQRALTQNKCITVTVHCMLSHAA